MRDTLSRQVTGHSDGPIMYTVLWLVNGEETLKFTRFAKV